MPIKTNEREYRDFTLAVAPSDDEEKLIVDGYASVFGNPYTLYEDSELVIQEQVDSKAFEGADLSDVIFQYNHEGRVFARTSNNTLSVFPDQRLSFLHTAATAAAHSKSLLPRGPPGPCAWRGRCGFSRGRDLSDGRYLPHRIHQYSF